MTNRTLLTKKLLSFVSPKMTTSQLTALQALLQIAYKIKRFPSFARYRRISLSEWERIARILGPLNAFCSYHRSVAPNGKPLDTVFVDEFSNIWLVWFRLAITSFWFVVQVTGIAVAFTFLLGTTLKIAWYVLHFLYMKI